MVLERVIGEVLLAFGEHHPVDLRLGARADERHVLIDLRQPAAERPNRPLQTGVAIDEALLMGEVPNARPPILQIHIPQLGLRADEQLDAAAVQTVSRRAAASRFREQGRLGTFLKHDEDVSQINSAIGDPGQIVKRFVDLHAAWNVEKCPAGPTCGMQGRELVISCVHGPKQMRLDQVAVFGHECVETSEQHAALRRFWIERRRNAAAVERVQCAGQLDAVLQQCGRQREEALGSIGS